VSSVSAAFSDGDQIWPIAALCDIHTVHNARSFRSLHWDFSTNGSTGSVNVVSPPVNVFLENCHNRLTEIAKNTKIFEKIDEAKGQWVTY